MDTLNTAGWLPLRIFGRDFRYRSKFDGALIVKFLSNVDFAGGGEKGCWLWTGSLLNQDEEYGAFYYANHRTPAHRFSYEAFVGDIPDGNHIHHLCERAGCVNYGVQHLEPQSPEAHLKLHGRNYGIPARWTHCRQGHPLVPYTDPAGFTSRRCPICRAAYSSAKQAAFRAEHPTRQDLNICRKGHPFTEKSTYYLETGARICTICRDERTARWRERNEAKMEAFNADRRTGLSREEMAARPACANGHPWEEETATFVNGYKKCRICLREAVMRAYEKAKAAKGPRQPKAICTNGHPIEGENVYVNPRGTNECRICRLAAKRTYNEKKKAARVEIKIAAAQQSLLD